MESESVSLDPTIQDVSATSMADLSSPAPRTLDGERLLKLFADLVPLLGRALPATTCVGLYDLTSRPPQVAASHGQCSASDLPLAKIMDTTEDRLRWERSGADGRLAITTAYLIRDVGRAKVAVLCLHNDPGPWQEVAGLLDALLADHGREGSPEHNAPPRPRRNVGAHDHVLDIARRHIDSALHSVGVPVQDMKKEHKVKVVARLHAGGLFLLKDAVEMAADAVGVTRFTVYNYLNELGTAPDGASSQAWGRT